MHILKIALIALGVFSACYLFHKLCDWMESQGWIYYRKTKASGNALGASAMELQNVFESGKSKHIIAAKETKSDETPHGGSK